MAITQITNNVILDNSILPVKMSISSALKTFLGNPTSSNFAATISDETGSGALVFASSPTLTTPFIAAINGGSAANNSITIQGTTNATRTTSYVLLQPNGGNVGIGTLTPNTTTILELSSTTRGFLPPRMTSTQRDAISGAAVPSGLTVFNSTDNALSLYTTVLSSWGNILTTHAGSFTSETLRNAVSDETGTGNLVFSTNPTFEGANVTGNLAVTDHFSAATKSFKIPHQTKEGYLQYGVVESDCHSVLIRGKISGDTITLPEHWSWLVDSDSVTTHLTPIGYSPYQHLHVISSDNQIVKVGGAAGEYYYVVYGTRKDVAPLKVEVE